MDIAGNNGGHKSVETGKDGKIILPLLIEVPQIPIEELKEATYNFGPKSLIGEGSYGWVYYSVLRSGRTAAIKQLDTSKQPDQEFLAHVRHSNVKLKGFYFKLTYFVVPLNSNMSTNKS